MNGKKAVFLDRDGTLNVEVNYLSTAKKLVLCPGAAAAVKVINDLHLPAIIVTNQSGIGRHMFNARMLEEIHLKLKELLKTEGDAKLDAIYYCPHLPRDGCNCRKPNLGMAELAKKEFNIDLQNSYFIGDRETDIEFGRRAGGKTVLVLTGYGKETKKLLTVLPDFIAQDLTEAVNWLKEDIEKNAGNKNSRN